MISKASDQKKKENIGILFLQMLEYINIFQACVAVYAVVGLGSVSGKVKMFGIQDASYIRKIDYLICFPGMFFRQIGKQKLDYDSWKPFINEILIQLTIHLVFAFVIYVFPIKNKCAKFLESLFSCCYTNLVIMGYPIIRAVYGENYLYIPVMANIVTNIFIVPLHTFLIYPENDKNSEEERYDDEYEVDDIENGIEKGTGNIHQVEHPEDHSKNGNHSGVSRDQSNNDNNHNEQNINNQQSDNHNEEDHEINIDQPTETAESSQDENLSKWKILFLSFATPNNVFIVIGIIWSATKWKMPVFIDTVAYDLEKAVLASGLFSIGIFLWEHPFIKGCPWIPVLFNLFLHFIVVPLISTFWSWVLNMDKVTAQVCLLIHALPAALIGYAMTINAGTGMRVASFTFYWSNLLFLPVLIIWAIVIKEGGLFN